MMVSTVLLRGKRRLERLMEVPGIRPAGIGAAAFGGGFLMSAVRVWGQMQPVSMGLTIALGGWRGCCSALGSAVGYRVLWGSAGNEGILWAIGAAVLVLIPMAAMHRAVGAACIVSGTGLIFPVIFSQARSPGLLLLRMTAAAGSAMLGELAVNRREPVARWAAWGGAVLALSGLHPMAGAAAAGVMVSAAPFPAAILAGVGAELGGVAYASGMAAVACCLHRLPMRDELRRLLSPMLACAGMMALMQQWTPGVLLAYSVGGAAGAAQPWHLAALPRRGSVGAAQVRLEQISRILTRFQRQLLEFLPPPLDESALLEQVKLTACGNCPRRDGCAGGECPVFASQLRRVQASRRKQEEFRMAMVQQYGFLAETLHLLSDRLPEGRKAGNARFRVLVSARSRGRERADGDRVSAFPGRFCRYYVLLCDGMGTGLGASEESRMATDMIRAMLIAGLAPESALGSVNSQLALMDRGGAVTVDLAEIRLDSGVAWIYKWGAEPCWLLSRGKSTKIGTANPPPGLGVTVGRENLSQASLGHGETLVMLSDGVSPDNVSDWAIRASNLSPGELANRILLTGTKQEDDATAVVIRLVGKGEQGASCQ